MRSTDPRVLAIRADKLVGTGSASMIAECFSDDDLVGDLDRNGIDSVHGAIMWAHDMERCYISRWLDTEPDDLQLVNELRNTDQALRDPITALKGGRS